MSAKYFRRHRLLLVTCLIVSLGIGTVAWAKDWYDYYLEAQRAVQKKDWQKAITLFEQAIAADSNPGEHKKYGTRFIAYYPYIQLGMAYLALGDIASADRYCQQALETGIEPQETIDKCLSITTKYLQRTPAASAPTPIPEQPVNSTEGGPQIVVESVIPAETADDSVVLKGVAIDSDGVTSIKLHIDVGGMVGTKTMPKSGNAQEVFNIKVLLAVGTNVITLEATDRKNQSASQTFTIAKISAGGVVQPAPTAIIPPTPIPTVPMPAPTEIPTPMPQINTKPSIQLLTDIPSETADSSLEIRGTATDNDTVKDVKVRVKQPGKKTLIIGGGDLNREGDEFTTTVQLSMGENVVSIEAIDSIGQKTTEEYPVMRIASQPVAEQMPSPAVPTQNTNLYAVIVGIGNYQDERIPTLEFTVNDAQGLYNLLVDKKYGGAPKDHIKLLLNEDATAQKIKAAIGKWLSEQAGPDDTVIIYYSGHGAPEKDETYWVTYEADIDDLYSTALSNNDIPNMLDKIESKRIITFLDSCYSAATVERKNKTRAAPVAVPLKDFSGEGRVVISASNGKQLSLELREYQHGVFSYYLLQGLSGAADQNKDGIVDVDEVWDYVKFQVSDVARKKGNPQTPILQGEMSAGIPLTILLERVTQNQREQDLNQKYAQLQTFFDRGLITPKQFNCAYKILESGKPNSLIDGLLSGDIEPQVFSKSFKCP